MWTRDEARRAAVAILPPELVGPAMAALRPAWRFELARTGPDPLVRIGGAARLGEREPWPRNARGIPLTAIAELHLAELPELPEEWADADPRPKERSALRIFADLVDSPYAPSPALVSPPPAGPLRRVNAPPMPDPWPPGGPSDDAAPEHRVRELPELTARAIPFLTLPESRPGTEWDSEEHWSRFGLLARVEKPTSWLEDPMRSDDVPDPWAISHVFGEPTSVQDDVRRAGRRVHPEVGDVAQWSVLLALHGHWSLGPLDAGAWHVLVPTDDIASSRWDRAVVEGSSL